MIFHFPKTIRLRKRSQYQRIAQYSTRYVGYWIVLDIRQSKQSVTRLGITASRHYGKAVWRNRFKRIVREAFRLCRLQLQPGLDLNIKPCKTALKATPKDIQTELLKFIGLPVLQEKEILAKVN